MPTKSLLQRVCLRTYLASSREIVEDVTCCEWPISTSFFLSSLLRLRLYRPGYFLYRAPRNSLKEPSAWWFTDFSKCSDLLDYIFHFNICCNFSFKMIKLIVLNFLVSVDGINYSLIGIQTLNSSVHWEINSSFRASNLPCKVSLTKLFKLNYRLLD